MNQTAAHNLGGTRNQADSYAGFDLAKKGWKFGSFTVDFGQRAREGRVTAGDLSGVK